MSLHAEVISSGISRQGGWFVIDGDQLGVDKTQFRGGAAVKLNDVFICFGSKKEELGKLEKRQIEGIKIENAVIWAGEDIDRLSEFVQKVKMKIDLSNSTVAQEAVRDLNICFRDLKARKYTVIEGSKIKLPESTLGIYGDWRDVDNLKQVSLEIGFQLV
jgi:hypothetical protein